MFPITWGVVMSLLHFKIFGGENALKNMIWNANNKHFGTKRIKGFVFQHFCA